MERAIARLLALIQEMTERESDFVVKKLYCTTLRLAKYNPLRGSSYIATPEKIASKHANVNIQNNDELCFLYSVAAAVFLTAQNPHRASQYKKHLSKFNTTGLKFPMEIDQIGKFEAMNPDI